MLGRLAFNKTRWNDLRLDNYALSLLRETVQFIDLETISLIAAPTHFYAHYRLVEAGIKAVVREVIS